MTTTDQTLEQPTADPARPPRPAQSAAAARVGGGVGEVATLVLDHVARHHDALADACRAAGNPGRADAHSNAAAEMRAALTGGYGWMLDLRDALAKVEARQPGAPTWRDLLAAEFGHPYMTEAERSEFAALVAHIEAVHPGTPTPTPTPTPAVADALARAEAAEQERDHAHRELHAQYARTKHAVLRFQSVCSMLATAAGQAMHSAMVPNVTTEDAERWIAALAARAERAEGERDEARAQNGAEAIVASGYMDERDRAIEERDAARAQLAEYEAVDAEYVPGDQTLGSYLQLLTDQRDEARGVADGALEDLRAARARLAAAEGVGEVAAWRWLYEMVQAGRGEVRFGITEDGDTGLFWDWWCDGEWTLGVGDTAEEAVAKAMRAHPKPEAQPVVPADSLARWQAWRAAEGRGPASAPAARASDDRGSETPSSQILRHGAAHAVAEVEPC